MKLFVISWIVINFIILFIGLILYAKGGDGAIIFTYIEYLVSFPIGFAVQHLMSIINYPVGIWGEIIIPWILFSALNFMQWFWLLKLTKK